MKNRGIREYILINFFISIILSAIVTIATLLFIICILHISCTSLYINFINSYNNSVECMMKVLLGAFLLFTFFLFVIFNGRVKVITNYIDEISKNVNKVAEGNLEINIPARYNNELSSLAKDINIMAFKIKELIKKEKELENQKNNLITNLSHDLKTPLTSIIGFLSLIYNNTYKSKEELEQYSRIALDKGKELKNLVDQLFEFNKISSEDRQLKKTRINIKELVEQVTISFIPEFEKNNMTYKIACKNIEPTVIVDVGLIARAFENIISNAIKYGSSGKYLDIILENEKGKIAISFINYGEKIDEKDIEILFNRFYREEKQCSKKEGSGLGLAIVKKIVDMHHGTIQVTSSQEKTIFKIAL